VIAEEPEYAKEVQLGPAAAEQSGDGVGEQFEHLLGEQAEETPVQVEAAAVDGPV
jgi:hypothetical protein